MADAIAQAKYVRKANDVKAKLKAKGHEASFGNDCPPATGYSGTGKYQVLGTASVFPLKWNADFSSDVRQDDAFYMASAETDIKSCSKMKLNDDEFTIVAVEPFSPDDVTVIYYEVQVRA